MVAKRTVVRVALAALSISHLPLLGVLGCAAPLTPGQKVRETAHEYAMSVRFGRLDLAMERVSALRRRDFSIQHAAWGGGIRILDCELSAVALRAHGHADVVLTVGWQRVDETEVRTTQIMQHWRDQTGTWVLEAEERAAGDVGLLGEPQVVVAPHASPGKAQFQSITIRGQSP